MHLQGHFIHLNLHCLVEDAIAKEFFSWEGHSWDIFISYTFFIRSTVSEVSCLRRRIIYNWLELHGV